MNTYENPWLFNGKQYNGEEAEKFVGFVYKITNKIDGRGYIGKKLLWSPKTSFVKNPKTGVKKKVKSMVDSDWRTYYGSSKELKEDIEKFGTENFQREILIFCTTKGNLSYLEMKNQILNEVMESPLWYNGFVGGKINKKHLKPQEGLNIYTAPIEE